MIVVELYQFNTGCRERQDASLYALADVVLRINGIDEVMEAGMTEGSTAPCWATPQQRNPNSEMGSDFVFYASPTKPLEITGISRGFFFLMKELNTLLIRAFNEGVSTSKTTRNTAVRFDPQALPPRRQGPHQVAASRMIIRNAYPCTTDVIKRAHTYGFFTCGRSLKRCQPGKIRPKRRFICKKTVKMVLYDDEQKGILNADDKRTEAYHRFRRF